MKKLIQSFILFIGFVSVSNAQSEIAGSAKHWVDICQGCGEGGRDFVSCVPGGKEKCPIIHNPNNANWEQKLREIFSQISIHGGRYELVIGDKVYIISHLILNENGEIESIKYYELSN